MAKEVKTHQNDAIGMLRSTEREADDSMSQDSHPEARRGATRHHVPLGISVSVTLPTKQSLFVNLRDISKTGACVVRQGTLDIKEDDTIIFEARNYDSGSTISIRSKVIWVRDTGFNTYLGLSFISTTLTPKSMLKLFS
ncbi:PilZ domain-containing protein [Cyanobium gracile]|uniref:PilZ domain-containing protein n=1 Tax=Cyanobium gracile UHCC 0281 TaxID=3110309 RepID=A0ABU5SV84_9CYAN|nr:PilZ domain-containing protein [Cyanobium gracile]MEA5442323.1 PilZ domain-containing protein [Cyanobium gracile UHCC 0281]